MITVWMLMACTRGGPVERPLTVLAASSLTDAMPRLEAAFEAAHPGVDVTVSFAGSQALATQVRHGIAADVIASADRDHVAALAAEGLAEAPRPFAANALVLAVPARTSEPVTLEDLDEVGSLVVGGPEVPVGRYTEALLDAAEARYGAAWREGVEARIVSREPNVRLVATKVALGEADAAIVYATDVGGIEVDGSEGLRAVPLPEELAPPAGYFHARLTGAPAPDLAAEWLSFVESTPGRALLETAGFQSAPAP